MLTLSWKLEECRPLRNGVKLSTFAAANFMRNELAASLRKGPYQAGGCTKTLVICP